MGNRISIQFKDTTSKSPVLFSHWAGIQLKELAETYVKELNKTIIKVGTTWPLYRKEARTVIVDFIRWLTQGEYYKTGEPVSSDLYMGMDENDGDNSDNGHFIIDLTKK